MSQMLWYKVARVQHLGLYPSREPTRARFCSRPAIAAAMPLLIWSLSFFVRLVPLRHGERTRYRSEAKRARHRLGQDGRQADRLIGPNTLEPADPGPHARSTPAALGLRQAKEAKRLLDLGSEEDAPVLQQGAPSADLGTSHDLAALQEDLVLGGAIEARRTTVLPMIDRAGLGAHRIAGLPKPGDQRPAEPAVRRNHPPVPGEQRKRQGDAVGEFTIVEDGPAAGGTPDDLDTLPPAGTLIDHIPGLEVSEGQAGGSPPVEAEGRGRSAAYNRVQDRLVDRHVPGPGSGLIREHSQDGIRH
jgi:hypothetical protein